MCFGFLVFEVGKKKTRGVGVRGTGAALLFNLHIPYGTKVIVHNSRSCTGLGLRSGFNYYDTSGGETGREPVNIYNMS